jgi:hypothetical protein
MVVGAGGQADLVGKLGDGTPLMMNLAFCRFVDQFLIYISDLLTVIFTMRPQMIKVNESITVEFALQFSTRDELLAALTERQVIELSFKGMLELNKYLDSRYSFSLFDDKPSLDRITALIERRNLFTHNRGVVNRRYLERVLGADEELGEVLVLNPIQVISDMGFLVGAVMDIDHKAQEKCGIPAHAIETP